MELSAVSELKKTFSPEFLNRIDEIIVFKPLDLQQMENIFDIQADELKKRIAEQGYSLELTGGVREIIIKKCRDFKYGARPLRREIQKNLEDPLSMLLLGKDPVPGTAILAYAEEGSIKFKIEVMHNNLQTVSGAVRA